MRAALCTLLCLLLMATTSSATVSLTSARIEAAALVENVSEYTRSHPSAPGAFDPWSGRVAIVDDVLLVHTYPTLEPTYYYLRVGGQTGVASFITVDAATGQWQAFGRVGGDAPPLDRDAARAALASIPGFDAMHGLRVVSMPDRRLYWHAGVPGKEEAFVEVADPGNIHIGLDSAIAPPAPELPTPPPEAAGPTGGGSSTEPFRYPTSYDIEDVPHHYQATSYNCGPAASEMVMDYYGPDIDQDDIADVANCSPSWGSYASDVMRTGHFSDISNAVQNSSLWGYNERSLGYGSMENFWSYPNSGDPDYPDRYNDLKNLISSDYPVLILGWYDSSQNSGHFRVIKGYDDNTNVFIVHDPWYTGTYQGPDVQFSQSFLVDNLWTQYYRWGNLIVPWEVEVDAPDQVLTESEFTVSATVTYRGPHPFDGQNSASSPTATIDPSPLFSLATGETATKSLSLTTSNTSSTVSWQLDAPDEHLGNIIEVTARGLISDSSFSYSSYSDSIGGQGCDPVTIVEPSLVLVDLTGNGHFETIQDALNWADSGDTVEVMPGLYTGSENRNLHFGGKAILLKSAAGAEQTIIDCQSLGRAFDLRNGESSSTVIEGFTVVGGATTGGTWPENSGGGMLLVGASPTVRSMVFANSQAAGFGGGVACFSGSSPTFDRVALIDNLADESGGAVAFATQSAGTLDHCTLHGNSAADAGGVSCDDSAALIQNSIISSSANGAAVACAGASPTFTHNVVYGNAGGDSLCGIYAGLGNIFEDPLFCDAPNNDFTIEDCSPCAGAGTGGGDIGAWPVGCECSTGVTDPETPSVLHLHRPAPSPFSTETTIALDVPVDAGSVTLSVFNARGQRIRTLHNGTIGPGRRSFTWDARDHDGSTVATGVYFARCEWREGSDTVKLVLVR